MDSKQIFLTSVIALVVSFLVLMGASMFDGSSGGQGGTPGSRTIESMLPGVQQAGGILSSKQMWINASTTLQGLLNVQGVLNAASTISAGTELGIGSTTPTEELGVIGDAFFFSTATTTIFVESSTVGGCLEMTGADGTRYAASVLATSTAPNGNVGEWRILAGTCQ